MREPGCGSRSSEVNRGEQLILQLVVRDQTVLFILLSNWQ